VTVEDVGAVVSDTPLMNALDVAVPVCAGPPLGTGQLAKIHTFEVSPAVTLAGLSSTRMGFLLTVTVGVALTEPVAEAEGVGVAEVCAEAEQPTAPIMTMAPAYATRLTLSTAAPHSAPSFTKHPPKKWTPPLLIPRFSGRIPYQ
jgi:hypothetical protein